MRGILLHTGLTFFGHRAVLAPCPAVFLEALSPLLGRGDGGAATLGPLPKRRSRRVDVGGGHVWDVVRSRKRHQWDYFHPSHPPLVNPEVGLRRIDMLVSSKWVRG